MSPSFPPQTASPPPGDANVRRNQSLTYGATGGTARRTAINLRRSGTLQAQIERPHAASSASPPSPVDNEEDFTEEDRFNDEEYQRALLQQQQQQQNALRQGTGQYTPNNTMGRSSPWSMNNNDWRYGAGISPGNVSDTQSALDDVQRALSALELSNAGLSQTQGLSGNIGQAILPPRLNQQGLAINQPSAIRRPEPGGLAEGNGLGSSIGQMPGSRLQLNTDLDVSLKSGPSSASTNVPSIGHGFGQRRGSNANGPWEQQNDRPLSSRSSNPNLQYSARNYDASSLPPNPPIPVQYLNQQENQSQIPRSGAVSPLGQNQQGNVGLGGQQLSQFFSPIDVPSLITAKGYNPSSFDCKPAYVRYALVFRSCRLLILPTLGSFLCH
jgi:YTH domain-containing family protein